MIEMKIILTSDSHGKDEMLDMLLEKYPDADLYVHCGDIEAYPECYPQFITVRGNNDLYYDYPDKRIVKVQGHSIYITHSHQFSYSKRIEQMAEKAKAEGCDLVFYGHTHIAAYDEVSGVKLINPGSIWRSRDGRGPSYAVITVAEDRVDVQFEFLPQPERKHHWFF